jgi:hypothetical protein
VGEELGKPQNLKFIGHFATNVTLGIVNVKKKITPMNSPQNWPPFLNNFRQNCIDKVFLSKSRTGLQCL